MKIGEYIYDTCPVCGSVRIGHHSIKLMICQTNDRCPVQYYPIPKGIKTGIEAATYAGWIPEKDNNGNTVYFNPKFEWIHRYHEAMRRECKYKYFEVATD